MTIKSEPWRVLVADADRDICSVVEDLLLGQGFEVRQAANSNEAVLELRYGTFDVLLFLCLAPRQWFFCSLRVRPANA